MALYMISYDIDESHQKEYEPLWALLKKWKAVRVLIFPMDTRCASRFGRKNSQGDLFTIEGWRPSFGTGSHAGCLVAQS